MYKMTPTVSQFYGYLGCFRGAQENAYESSLRSYLSLFFEKRKPHSELLGFWIASDRTIRVQKFYNLK